MTREEFEKSAAPHLPWIRTLIRTRLRTTDHAEDLVQQTLLRAFAYRHQLRSPAKFRSWLGSIAINEVRVFHRSARPTASLEESPNIQLTDAAPSPFARCVQMEREARLRAGLAALTERDRIAIQLVDLNGLSYSEAADVMTVSMAAFKSTHYRAMQRLGREVREAGRPASETLPRAA